MFQIFTKSIKAISENKFTSRAHFFWSHDISISNLDTLCHKRPNRFRAKLMATKGIIWIHRKACTCDSARISRKLARFCPKVTKEWRPKALSVQRIYYVSWKRQPQVMVTYVFCVQLFAWELLILEPCQDEKPAVILH